MEKKDARGGFPARPGFQRRAKGRASEIQGKEAGLTAGRGCAGIYPNRNFTGQPLLYRAHPPPRGRSCGERKNHA